MAKDTDGATMRELYENTIKETRIDAERYRWLRRGIIAVDDYSTKPFTISVDVADNKSYPIIGEALDEAIDNSMKAEMN